MPLAGAGTSASTLSVETSTTVSPSSTNSPSCLCHSSTVPSVTDSPIWGIWISTIPELAISSVYAAPTDGVQSSDEAEPCIAAPG